MNGSRKRKIMKKYSIQPLGIFGWDEQQPFVATFVGVENKTEKYIGFVMACGT